MGAMLRPREALEFYQGVAVDFALDTHRCALWLEMGLGKTAITLTVIHELLSAFEVYRVLVVGPKRVVRNSWPDEIAAWEHTSRYSYTLIDGNEKKRAKAACEDTSIHLVSRDNLVWLVEFWNGRCPYDMVVLDESSGFRNPKSKRTRAAKILCGPEMKRVIELTGTPAPNGLHQVWSQIYLLDQGRRLGQTYSAYIDRWFDENPYEKSTRPKAHAEKAIYERLKDICFTLRSEDYQKLPPLIHRAVRVDMGEQAYATYNQLRKKAILEVGESKVAAFSAAALAQKLFQYCNGAVYVGEAGEYQVFHDEKIGALSEIVEDSLGPVLVIYNYKSDLARIKKAFPKARLIDSDQSIKDWNAGKIEIGLMHPASGGMGLNLQDGGNVVVWFGLTWDLELYQQTNKRLHRKGQLCPVIVHHLISKGTLDEAVVEVLPEKAVVQDRLLDAMKRHLAQSGHALDALKLAA